MSVEAERIFAASGTVLAVLVHTDEPILVTPSWGAAPTGVLQVSAATATESTVVLNAAALGTTKLSVEISTLGKGHANILAVDPTALANADRPFESPHVAGSRPTVAVVRSRGQSRCDDYRTVVFGGAAPMGHDLQPCVDFSNNPTGGEVALFETGRAAQLLSWPVNPTRLTFPPGTPPLKVTVDLEGHDGLGAAVWEEWWVYAQELFALNRVGAKLDSTQAAGVEAEDRGGETASAPEVSSTAVQGCSSIPPYPRLTLLFVNEARDHLGQLVRGLWCPAQWVAVISLSLGSPTEIPHELAHAFGVALHMASSIDPLNLMTPHASDKTAAARTRFTVGQVFTMNFASYSLLALQRPVNERRWCPEGCPFLVFDVPRGR